MAERTGIAWCDATVNFWLGCAEVSTGCDNCYARTLAGKFHRVAWGPHAERKRVLGAHKLAVRLQRRAVREGRRLRVFTNSMSDFFDHAAPPGEREAAWATIRACDALDWLILTKRPQNFARFLPDDWGVGWPHIWLGVSAENLAEADRRIPILLNTHAAVRWVSAEPLLSRLTLRWPVWHYWPRDWRERGMSRNQYDGLRRLDWVVIGGESGPGRRDCGVDAIVGLARECVEAGVPVFVKQDCAHRPDQQGRIPDVWFIRQWPASRGASLAPEGAGR